MAVVAAGSSSACSRSSLTYVWSSRSPGERKGETGGGGGGEEEETTSGWGWGGGDEGGVIVVVEEAGKECRGGIIRDGDNPFSHDF